MAPSVEVIAVTGEGGGGGYRTRVGVDNKLPACGMPCALCNNCVTATMAGISIFANSIVSDEICGEVECTAAIAVDRPVIEVMP